MVQTLGSLYLKHERAIVCMEVTESRNAKLDE